MTATDQVLEINDIEALGPYADAWRARLAETSNATFFQSLDWLQAYWQHYGQNQRLRVMVVVHDGQPIGFVPLVVRSETKGFANVRVLTYPLHDWGTCYGPIGADPERLLAASMKWIRNTPRDWDLLDLRWIMDDAGARGPVATESALASAGFRVRRRHWKRTAVVDTIGDWDAYLSSRSQKFRGSIRRYRRRLEEQGELEFSRYRPLGAEQGDDALRWGDFEQCVQLAERSWQGSSTDGTTLSHDSVAAFLRTAHRSAVRCGCLDLNLLRLDGRLIAFAYNYCYEGFVTGLRIGYDPDFAAFGPGKVLWACSFEDSFRRGDRLYELGSESMSVKGNWLTRIVPVYAYAYYPPLAAKTQWVRLGHWVKELQTTSTTP